MAAEQGNVADGPGPESVAATVEAVQGRYQDLLSEIHRVIVGQDEIVEYLVSGLRLGLGMPALPNSGGPVPLPPASPADTVAGALASNSYAQLKAKNKVIAAQGLRELVAQLGDPPDSQLNPIQPNILSRAGSDANAALISAMGSPYLSERVGAYAMYQHLHPNTPGSPPFDPWSTSPIRSKQLTRLTASRIK